MNLRISDVLSFMASKSAQLSPSHKRFILVGSMITLAIANSILDLRVATLPELILAVSSYALLSLASYYWLTLDSEINDNLTHQSRSNQVVFAALVGAIPGIGGAILVVTQFFAGKLNIGALLAAIISTVGNAVFFFFANEFHVAFAVIALSIIVGSALGKILNLCHIDDLLRPNKL